MPKFLEDKLKAEAAKEGKTGRAADRYVYGAMNNMGAMHGNKETAKGARMDAKHAADMKAKNNLGAHLGKGTMVSHHHGPEIVTEHHRGAKKS